MKLIYTFDIIKGIQSTECGTNSNHNYSTSHTKGFEYTSDYDWNQQSLDLLPWVGTGNTPYR